MSEFIYHHTPFAGSIQRFFRIHHLLRFHRVRVTINSPNCFGTICHHKPDYLLAQAKQHYSHVFLGYTTLYYGAPYEMRTGKQETYSVEVVNADLRHHLKRVQMLLSKNNPH